MTEAADRLRELARTREAAAAKLPAASQAARTLRAEAANFTAQAARMDAAAAARPAFRTGRKLTTPDVENIIAQTRAGERHAIVARLFGVCPDVVSRIVRGELWKDVLPGEWRGRSRRVRRPRAE